MVLAQTPYGQMAFVWRCARRVTASRASESRWRLKPVCRRKCSSRCREHGVGTPGTQNVRINLKIDLRVLLRLIRFCDESAAGHCPQQPSHVAKRRTQENWSRLIDLRIHLLFGMYPMFTGIHPRETVQRPPAEQREEGSANPMR